MQLQQKQPMATVPPFNIGHVAMYSKQYSALQQAHDIYSLPFDVAH